MGLVGGALLSPPFLRDVGLAVGLGGAGLVALLAGPAPVALLAPGVDAMIDDDRR